MTRRVLVPLFTAAMLAASALAAPAPAAVALVGKPIPLFALPDSAGGDVRLADYRGNVTVIVFLASWSPVCRTEMPHLVDFADRHPEIAFVGVAIHEQRGAEGVQDFVSRYKVPFPIAMGNEDAERLFHTGIAPTIFVVDRSGTVTAVFAGDDSRIDDIAAAVHAAARQR